MSELRRFIDRQSEDEAFRAEYERLGPLYEVIRQVIARRMELGLSQAQLAEQMGKQQPAIARLESGRVNPSLEFLRQLADALECRVSLSFEPLRKAGSRSRSARRRVLQSLAR